MGLFGGLFNYAKEGPGVSKDAPKKKRFFLFFELYFRKFWKLCLLNIIYVLFCIPMAAAVFALYLIVSRSTDFTTQPWFMPAAVLSFVLAAITFGPATAGATYVLRNFAREEHAYIWYHFWKAFKTNFRQAWVMGVIDIVVSCLAAWVIWFYAMSLGQNSYFIVLLVLSVIFLIVFITMNYYVYLVMVTVELPFRHLIKNSFILSVLGVKYNVVVFIFTLIIGGLQVLFFPITLPVVLVIGVSTPMFISTFGVYPVVKKYCIDPVVAAQGTDADADDEAVFSDELLIKDGSRDDDDDED